MIRRFNHHVLLACSALALILGAGLGLAACDDAGGSSEPAAGTATGGGAGEATEGAGAEGEGAAEGEGTVEETPELSIPADCGFDPANAGQNIGKHIDNIKFKQWNQEKWELHYDCGGDAKVLWIFLSTGWCGKCEAYAPTAEALYQEHGADGLRVLWVVGETDDYEPPDWEYMQAYWEKKEVSFKVVRDAGFDQIYTKLDPSTPSLPHQYILDAQTMELVWKCGGVGEEGSNNMLSCLEGNCDPATFEECTAL